MTDEKIEKLRELGKEIGETSADRERVNLKEITLWNLPIVVLWSIPPAWRFPSLLALVVGALVAIRLGVLR